MKWDGEFVVGSMWDQKSPLFSTHEELYSLLVPTFGMAETTDGEAIRCIARLYYDAYNNGGMNSYYEGENEFLDYLKMWFGSQNLDGSPIEKDRLEMSLRRLQESIEYAWKFEEDEEEHEIIGQWCALEDKHYLEALELLAHWVTWKVAKLKKNK